MFNYLSKKRVRFGVLGVLILFISAVVVVSGDKSRSEKYHAIKVETEGYTTVLKVEFATTAEQREIGLMNRKSLDTGSGMLFIFPEERPLSFWMKNTLIPLDIIYFDANKKFVSITRNALPCDKGNDCPTYDSKGPAKYVLETNPGKIKDEMLGNEAVLVGEF
jgi:uncharacterized membrane protein (UPF0127 family)